MEQLTLDQIEKLFRSRRPTTVGNHRFFAVLLPLIEDENGLSLLYEVRGQKLNRQPGEICFPGGALEEGETPLQCAVRETCEELGVSSQDIRIISKLDTLYTVSNFTVFCYLGVLDSKAINLNKEEVETVFQVPLDYLIENPPEMHFMNMLPEVDKDFPYEKIDFSEGYKWRTGKADIPIYQYENRVIWGITARMTQNFINVLEGAKR